MIKKFAVILVKNGGINILLNSNKKLFNFDSPQYNILKPYLVSLKEMSSIAGCLYLPDDKRSVQTEIDDRVLLIDQFYWVLVLDETNEIGSDFNKLLYSDFFYQISDYFNTPINYLISSQYNIIDSDTVYWLNTFQYKFIGYEPDFYENVSIDSYS